MRFSHAIVRTPGDSFAQGLTGADLGLPELERARAQHRAYIAALIKCGLDVTVLAAEERFPDATFVEDVAVVTDRVAVVTNPGAPSRNGEADLIRSALEGRFPAVERITAPGTLDGGDVMQVDTHFFIGLSARTNAEGAAQLSRILSVHGFTAETVPLKSLLHLKTGVAYLGGSTLLAAGELVDHPAFAGYRVVSVPAGETYAANCLCINERILVADGFDATHRMLTAMGYEFIPLAMSEFQKMDGGLSCLSLRF